MYSKMRTNDRRKGPDALLIWVKLSSIISWVIVGGILIITLIAKPDFVSYIDRSFHIKLNSSWDSELMQFAFMLMLFQFFFCMSALIINMLRFRRKSDRLNPSLIANIAISALGIILYAVYFLLS